MIKAIVFDLGGVLVDLDLQKCRKAFQDYLGYSKIDELLDLSHQKGIYSDLEEGKLTADEFRALILKDSRPEAKPADVDRAMHALLVDMEKYKVAVLEDLTKRFDVYLLSNNNPISMKRCHDILTEAGLDWQHVFKKEFLSWQMKMLKPGAAIYKAVIEGIGCKPEEIMFLDDSMHNIDAAYAQGIKAVHYIQGTDLRSTIEKALEESI